VRKHEVRLERYDWDVTCYIGYTANDTKEICRALEDIGCGGDALSEAYGHLSKDSAERGLTYSNIREKRSVVAVGKSLDRASMVNTIGHELLHVVAHVCEADGIDMTDEEACYMMGGLCEKVFERIVE